MASYDALINLKLKGLKDLKKVENIVDKINKPVRTANRTARAEAQILDSKRAQQDMMSKTRRVGDLVQKQADKGLKMGRAQEAIQKSALMNQKKEFVESEKLLKVALNELKIQKAITRETAQQATNKSRTVKSSGGLDVLTGISQSRFGSAKTIGSPRYFASRAGMMQGPAAPPYAPGMYGSSPIGGSKFMFGSPAQVAFSGSGMGRSPILGSKDLVGSPKNILDVAKQNTLPVKGLPSLVGSPAYYDAQNKEFKRIAKANAMPVQGFKHLVGSPAYLKDQQQKMQKLMGGDTGFSAAQYGPQQPMQGPRMFGQAFDPTGGSSALNFDKRTGRLLQGPAGSSRNTRGNLLRRFGPTKGFDTQSALISGAFPLLFGQGPIGAAAGALGGGIGGMFGQMGGFAGGIAATALVQQIQTAITAISDLGKALGPFTQNTEAVVSSLGLQNTVQEAQIRLIEQVEGKTAAFNAAMKLMANDIGQKGVDALKQFGESSRILSSQFTLAITKLQAFAAGVANFVLRITGLENRLKKADAGRVVGAAAVRGNSQALGLMQRQKQIDEMDTRGGEGKRKEALQAQLDIEKQIFAIREQQKTKLAEITLEYDQAVQKNKEELQLKEAVKKLTETGMSQAIAKEVAQREQLRDKVLEEVDALADALRIERAKLGNTDTELERLKEIDAVLADILKKRQEINGETEKAVKAIKDQDKEIKKVKVTKEEIADLLANEMTNALMGLIEGTKSLGESLASIAKSLAKMFLNAAFQNIFNNMFQISEQGSYNRAGGFKAFQYGGVVNSPTLGMIGEGGESEYVIPASKMDGAMARYSAGARGGAVIPGGSHESGTVAGGSGNAIVEYTGPVLNFNGDEYVPKTAVPEIINTAARRGGEAGQAKAFATLKNSRSQRATLGL